MCGEHCDVGLMFLHPSGSSPHVRGTPRKRSQDDRRKGIIPACAGNTRWPAGCRGSAGDHPRMCGEHCGGHVALRRGEGSSPHVRGTPGAKNDIRPHRGIIPACAGNTRTIICFVLNTRDHPRMCGEHYGQRDGAINLRGSSPHVRGTPTRFKEIT